MAINDIRLITVTCDHVGCPNTIACGNDENYAENNGWHLGVPIFDRILDLCPEDYGDLLAWLDPEHPDAPSEDNEADDPPMDLKEVLQGEQPRKGEEDL